MNKLLTSSWGTRVSYSKTCCDFFSVFFSIQPITLPIDPMRPIDPFDTKRKKKRGWPYPCYFIITHFRNSILGMELVSLKLCMGILTFSKHQLKAVNLTRLQKLINDS